MNGMVRMWEQQPLRFVLLVALFLRLLAVFFSPGYLMHDDHFLVVEAAASWADGEDYDNWLPWNQGEEKRVHPANFAYVGTQFLIFKAFNAIGVDAPQTQMLLLRLIHALYSLLIVYFAFKITEKVSNTRTAAWAALLLGVMAIMPNFSVRQLVEMICIPPLMWAFWVLIKHDQRTWKQYLIAGVGIGLATGFRFQCGVFGIGAGLALLLKREYLGAVILGISSLFFFSLAQIQDVFIWGEPFTQLRAYINYNDENAGNYPNGPWYMYLGTLALFMVPPVSLFLLFGFFYIGRKHLLLFVPALAFLVFHSLFPNKQERFIFPAIPFIVMLGMIGWNAWVERSRYWKEHKGLLRSLWISFWVINSLALVLLTFTYGKRARVEAMTWLYEQGDEQNFILVYERDGSEAMPPLFYQGDWDSNYWFRPGETDIPTQRAFMCRVKDRLPLPNYVLFYGQDPVEEVQLFREAYPSLDFRAIAEPGLLDQVLHRLNPNNNKLEIVHIYAIDPDEICE